MHVLALLLLIAPPAEGVGDFDARVQPILKQRCFECHSGAHPKSDLALDRFRDEASVRAEPEVWREVRARLAAGAMPPSSKPRPAPAEIDTLLDWIDTIPGAAKPPGRSVLRRLNRREYENTVRDLFGVALDARTHFAADDVGAGFDVLGSVLSLSDSALEKYLQAAEEVASKAVILEDAAHAPRTRFGPAELHGGSGGGKSAWRTLATNGELTHKQLLPREGEYAIRARAFGTQAGPEPARMALKAGERELARFDVTAVRDKSAVYETRAFLAAGELVFAAAFLNDYYMPDDPDPKLRDRNLHVEWLEIEGPLDPPELSRFQRSELADLSRENLSATLQRCATRIWRRPADAHEVDALLALSKSDAPPLERLRSALVALLSSPRFLFRLEPDPPGSVPGSARRLDGWELAARLSYFLWSSTPDPELAAQAANGALTSDAVLERQFARLLADPRAGELVRGFALQWLQLDGLERAAPDVRRFPHFDDNLRASMRAETLAFVEAVLREDRPIGTLLDADFSFVDERLAQHYGIAGVHGAELRRVNLERERRGGLLGQASVLTVTSNPTRTSPVKRGKWILDVLLDAPPPPPPPGVGVLEENTKELADASLRERLAAHRNKPECAVCHARLDPLGLVLENYDAVGAWREREGEHAIDSSGELPDGRRIRGRAELVALLEADDAFLNALAKKLMIYALGRELGSDDERALRTIVRSFPHGKATLSAILRAIVLSEPFRTTRVAQDR